MYLWRMYVAMLWFSVEKYNTKGLFFQRFCLGQWENWIWNLIYNLDFAFSIIYGVISSYLSEMKREECRGISSFLWRNLKLKEISITLKWIDWCPADSISWSRGSNLLFLFIQERNWEWWWMKKVWWRNGWRNLKFLSGESGIVIFETAERPKGKDNSC